MGPSDGRTLGIVAGGGALPAALIAACRAEGRPVFVLALEGQAEPGAAIETAPHAWLRLGEAGRGITLLRDAGITEIVLAGRVRRPSLTELRPDRWTARVMAKVGWSVFGDNALLATLVREIEAEGFRIVRPEAILAAILATSGTYGRHAPDPIAMRDIERGAAVVRALGTLDIGQAVVVQEGLVLGVEAIEGTDALIGRCAALARTGPGGVLVKLAKPGQELRVDLPTIGPTTVERCAAAGLRGIAVEAGRTLVLDRGATVAAADTRGLFLTGIEAPPR
ncbi:MAG: LpxI family protein [Alphaproteobacteria bacterium]|nr:LpxI family protein [Alphaproteobacteria bacterium]